MISELKSGLAGMLEESKEIKPQSSELKKERIKSNDQLMHQSPQVQIFDIAEEEQADDIGTNDLHRSTIALNMRFNDKTVQGRNSFLNHLP